LVKGLPLYWRDLYHLAPSIYSFKKNSFKVYFPFFPKEVFPLKVGILKFLKPFLLGKLMASLREEELDWFLTWGFPNYLGSHSFLRPILGFFPGG